MVCALIDASTLLYDVTSQ